MVRTRSGVEVRIVQKRNDEDEIVIENDNAGEDDGVDASDGEDESRNNGEETLENLYNVELYYGGHFVHVPYESYTSNVKRVYKNVDLEKLSIDELKSCFKGPVGEFDSLYFRSPELKIYLLNAESKPVLIELSKNCGNVVKLYVYHVSLPTDDSDIEREYSDDEFAEIRKSCRAEKKKMDDLKGKKRGTKEKQPAPEPMEEESAEVHLQEQEILTGEDDLMNETMAEMETSVAQEAGPSKGMKFMPTPSLIQLTSTGCTPPASTPPTVAQPAKKKAPRKSVKSFAPPRPKKQ